MINAYELPPVAPQALVLDTDHALIRPQGPLLVRRMSDLEGLFRDAAAWEGAVASGNEEVYRVAASPVPEIDRELPQSVTTIQTGRCGDEYFMTKGHQHPNHQGEIYLGLAGVGQLLMFDGSDVKSLDMAPGVIGYIPPGWAHRSINTGDEPYSFLAVYPGSAGHDYEWVLRHGMGVRVIAREGSAIHVPYHEVRDS